MKYYDMRGGNNSANNLVLNVVTVNLNVLLTLMKSGIANNDNINLIITIYGHRIMR